MSGTLRSTGAWSSAAGLVLSGGRARLSGTNHGVRIRCVITGSVQAGDGCALAIR
jgi:hypothetical protein